MPSGLFGKLPAKRDFVSMRAPRRFLDAFEPWLQAGVASSRQEMGAAWQDAYLKMPLWRFWIGAAHTGVTAAGVFMPSVDGVGRYFPLAVFALAEGGAAFLPPELGTADGWYDAVEALALTALDPATPYEAFASAVAALPDPDDDLIAARPEQLRRLPGGGIAVVDPVGPLSSAFAAARIEDHAVHHAGQCCFWTTGGDGFPPTVIVDGRLPPPTRFSLFLTGAATGLARPVEAVR